MSKLIGLTVLAILVGTSVVAATRSATGPANPSPRTEAFSPEAIMQKMDTSTLPLQPIDLQTAGHF